MPLSRRDFALTLALTPGIGGKSVIRILARQDLLSRSPEAFLKLSEEAYREEYKLSAKAASNLKSQSRGSSAAVASLVQRLDQLGVNLITAADAHYPALVDQMDPDPPGVLFLYGNQKLLEARTFSVLSSRNTSPAGLEKLESLAESGVLEGEVLVSGHDRPEYQRTALVPLRWGAPRILVLDRGHFQALGEHLRDEPFRTARLWRYQFDPKTDLTISPFRPDAKFVGVNNQIRDRLIASLSRRVDFVEISATGNMAKNLRLALKAGRPVRITDRSVGYRQFLEAGAQVIPG